MAQCVREMKFILIDIKFPLVEKAGCIDNQFITHHSAQRYMVKGPASSANGEKELRERLLGDLLRAAAAAATLNAIIKDEVGAYRDEHTYYFPACGYYINPLITPASSFLV